jgi:LuxR family transcriptional regulator
MKSWQEDLLSVLSPPLNEQAIFDKIALAARGLGFEYCSYGLRCPLPVADPKVLTLFDYPAGWAARYHAAGYVGIDPTVLHGRRSQALLVWSDAVFASTPQLWDEARSFGIRVGWAQSSLDASGVGSMLTLARSREALSPREQKAKEQPMEWLVSIAHLALARLLTTKLHQRQKIRLTQREIEVLRWTADGKTSSEVGKILAIAVDTVNFHMRNAQSKLGVCNKTAAVAKAVILGWLN